MRKTIEDLLNTLWAKRGYFKLNWLEYEDNCARILNSDMSDYEKVQANKELLDAFTRRGHFNASDYLTKP